MEAAPLVPLLPPFRMTLTLVVLAAALGSLLHWRLIGRHDPVARRLIEEGSLDA